MRSKTILALALCLGFGATVADAQIRATDWRYPGREPFMGSCEEGMAIIPLDADEIKKNICKQREAVTISFETLEKHLKNYSEAAVAGVREKARKLAKRRFYLEDLKALEAPAAVVAAVEREEISAEQLKKSRTTMAPGRTLDFMVLTDPKTGVHRVVQQVRWNPAPDIAKEVHPAYLDPDGKSLVVYEYTAETKHHKVTAAEPAVCHNIGLETGKYPPELVRTAVRPKPAPTAEKPLPSGEPPRNTTLMIYLWSLKHSSPEGRSLLKQLRSGVAGRQSANLSDEIVQAAAENKVKPAPGCWQFWFEFHDASAAEFPQGQFWASRQKEGEDKATSAAVEPKPNTTIVEVSACNGQGSLVIPVPAPWSTAKVTHTLTSPFKKPAIFYPASGSLRSCGPATYRRCGGPTNNQEWVNRMASGPTFLSQALARPKLLEYHFVLNDE